MRTPLTIFAFGLGGCLAMGLMMQHLLRVSQERNQPRVIREINRIYGPRLDGEARLRYVRRTEGTLAEVSISPLVIGTTRELARDIGQFVWRGTDDRVLSAVEVVCEDPLGDGKQRVVVERPFQANASVTTKPEASATKIGAEAPSSGRAPASAGGAAAGTKASPAPGQAPPAKPQSSSPDAPAAAPMPPPATSAPEATNAAPPRG